MKAPFNYSEALPTQVTNKENGLISILIQPFSYYKENIYKRAYK